MSPTLQKIFMLQRHQLIRWGGLTGYMSLVFGILIILVAVVGFQTMNSKLKVMESQSQKITAATIKAMDSANSFEQLKSITHRCIDYHSGTQTDLIKLNQACVGFSHVIFFMLGIMLVGYGALSFRLKELAQKSEVKSKGNLAPNVV